MAVPSLSISAADPFDSDASVLVIGVITGGDGPRLASQDPRLAAVGSSLASVGMTGATESTVRLPAPVDAGPALLLVGLGVVEGDAPSVAALRDAAASAIRKLTGVSSVAIAFPTTSAEGIGAVLEGAGTAAYAFPEFRSAEIAADKTPPSMITVHAAAVPDGADALVDRATAVTIAVHTVRDLVNTPPNALPPAELAERAINLASGLPVTMDILDEKELAEGGYGGILGVGQGSSRPPRLVVVRYAPEGATRHLSLVGKGITFDSGGLSLKPAAGMVGMKYDMTGAATVLAVVLAVARLGLPVTVTARMCVAENLPSGTAMRPNDVIVMRGGTTVEVLNTDAEGRLVLGDGLVDASEEQPDAIVDVATLTGAARVAMGDRIVPVMGDRELGARIIALGETAGESFWPMPLPPELRANLESDVADLANAKPGSTAGGMLLAAHFLKHFVGNRPDGTAIPWAHLDIAGPANNSATPYGIMPKGPTGVTVRSLIALAEDFAAK